MSHLKIPTDPRVPQDTLGWTTEEMGYLLRTSPGAVRNKVYRKEIPHRKIGGKLFFPKADIEKWLASREGISADEVE